VGASVRFKEKNDELYIYLMNENEKHTGKTFTILIIYVDSLDVFLEEVCKYLSVYTTLYTIFLMIIFL